MGQEGGWAPCEELGPERRREEKLPGMWEGLRDPEVGIHCCLVRCSWMVPSLAEFLFTPGVSGALGSEGRWEHSVQP